MTEAELIEHMARAMFPTAWADDDSPDHDAPLGKKYARFKAAAALAAIREAGCEVVPVEPTREMLEAGTWAKAPQRSLTSQARATFSAMLSASPLKGDA